jgi:hypothetical protein
MKVSNKYITRVGEVEHITITGQEEDREEMVATQIGEVGQMIDYENKRGIEGGCTYGKVDASSYER